MTGTTEKPRSWDATHAKAFENKTQDLIVTPGERNYTHAIHTHVVRTRDCLPAGPYLASGSTKNDQRKSESEEISKEKMDVTTEMCQETESRGERSGSVGDVRILNVNVEGCVRCGSIGYCLEEGP